MKKSIKNQVLSGFSVFISSLLLGALMAGCSSSGGGSTPALSVQDNSVLEGDSATTSLVFTVSLNKAASSAVTVDYATSDGTASSASDYSELTGTLTIAAGDTSGTIPISVNGETDIESDETFTLTLSNASGASISDGTATGTITSDDHADATGYYTGTAAVKEGDNSTDLAVSDLQGLINGDRFMLMSVDQELLLYDIQNVTINGTGFSGLATIYRDGVYLGQANVTGSIDEGVGLSGTLSGSGAGNGTFTLAYDAVVNADTASLGVIGGTLYSGRLNSFIADYFNFNINADGHISATSPVPAGTPVMEGCEVTTGSSLSPVLGQNLYVLTFVFSNCTDLNVNGIYTGFATTKTVDIAVPDGQMPGAFSNGSFSATSNFGQPQ